ncbi:polymer-forming cytoskeletal protein [Patescibacteria group bacterium]
MEENIEQYETTIGPSVKVEGDMVTSDNMRIDGIVSGKVHTDANLSIGQTATIEASVEASSATVSGKIQGNVIANEFLHLTDSARVFGDVEAKMLQVDRGAFFSGNCKMPSPENSGEQEMPQQEESESAEEQPEE